VTTGGTFVDALDDEYLEVGQLRSEVMRARGYDNSKDNAETSPPVLLVPAPEARCAICKNAIPATRKKSHPRAVTCGDACAHKRTTQRQKAYNQRLSGSQRKAATVTVLNGSQEMPAMADSKITEPEPPVLGSPRLVSIVRQLASSGLRLRLTVEGCDVEVTQRHDHGETLFTGS
jgi:hypothetical protein